MSERTLPRAGSVPTEVRPLFGGRLFDDDEDDDDDDEDDDPDDDEEDDATTGGAFFSKKQFVLGGFEHAQNPPKQIVF